MDKTSREVAYDSGLVYQSPKVNEFKGLEVEDALAYATHQISESVIQARDARGNIPKDLCSAHISE